MANKVVSTTKKTSTLFLVTVLVTGTITAIFPSLSFMKEVQAQPSYYEYNNYGPPEYQDNRYHKSYGNDNGYDKSQYSSSYKPDYKSKYTSYDKKDSSTIINKIKCTTNNIVVNGNNTGDVNIGHNDQVPTAEEGYLGAYSSGGGYDSERYNNGYDNKKNKGFTCIIENNNIINNIVAGAGNATDGNGNVTDTCEECLLDALGPTNLILLENFLAGQPPTASNNLEEFCLNLETQIASGTSFEVITGFINNILLPAGITLDPAELASLTACIFEVVGGWTDNKRY